MVWKDSPLIWQCLLFTVTLSNTIRISESKYVHDKWPIVATFSDQKGALINGSLSSHFNHLVVDQNTGLVYIGEVNKLYRLDEGLRLLDYTITGPKEDSPLCDAQIGCPPTTPTASTNNINKALVIDYVNSSLISCGSLFQGSCSIRALDDLSAPEIVVKEAVVANTASASTVAFIGPGPNGTGLNSSNRVLYVGVSFTINGPFRSEVPAVSSRSLRSDSLFQIAEKDATTGTRLHVNSLSRERYPITYVYGFSSEGFSYFLTTQREKTRPSKFISKIIRVCQNDEDYYSYTEIPLECTNMNDEDNPYNLVQAGFVTKPGSKLANDLNITRQDDVLFAVFSNTDRSENEFSSKPGKKSAMCVYSLQSIRKKFTENIRRCFNGTGARGLNFVTPSLPCLKINSVEIDDDFCGIDVNNPLGGNLPMVAKPIITFTTRLTSVIATTISEYSVAFLGTADGHLKKVAIQDTSKTFEVEELVIDKGHQINPDMAFDPQIEFVYVMTDKKLVKILIRGCPIVSTCHECLALQNPFCGWCMNGCSDFDRCMESRKVKDNWLSFNSSRCPTVTSVQPNQVSVTSSKTLSITIEDLPLYSDNGTVIKCLFINDDEDSSYEWYEQTPGRMAGGNEIFCNTPEPNVFADALTDFFSDHLNSKLEIRIDGDNGLYNVVKTNVTFYNCEWSYSSCSRCVSSQFPCNWCVDGNLCTEDTSENCRNDILVTGINRVGPTIRAGPEFCPALGTSCNSSLEENGSKIKILSGTKESICFEAKNIPLFMSQLSLECQFSINSRYGKRETVNGKYLDGKIYCDEAEFLYDECTQNVSANFKITYIKANDDRPWDDRINLENPENVEVIIYKNQEMIENCCNYI